MQSERSVGLLAALFQSYPLRFRSRRRGGKWHRKEAEVVRAHEDTTLLVELRHPRRQKSQRRPTSAEPFVLLTHLLFPDSTAQIRFLAVVTRIDRIGSDLFFLRFPFSSHSLGPKRFSRARVPFKTARFPFRACTFLSSRENRRVSLVMRGIGLYNSGRDGENSKIKIK